MDVNIMGYDIADPVVALTTTAGAISGHLGLGNYQYQYTFTTAFGETKSSASSAPATTLTGSMNVSIPQLPSECITVNLYRTTSGGGVFLKLVEIPYQQTDIIGNTYIDTTADGSLTIPLPTLNTAYSREKMSGSLLLVHPLRETIVRDIVGGTPGVQATATPLTATINFTANGGNINGAFMLPELTPNLIGMSIKICTYDETPAQVYPYFSQQINDLGVNQPVLVNGFFASTFTSVDATSWFQTGTSSMN